MKYTIYQITNLIDGKTYVGCHKTDNLDDGYMGSGRYLKRAIEKHGIENFHKDILGVFDNPEEMFHMESVLVNKDFVKRPDTYNLKEGGSGGWSYLNTPENRKQKIDAGKIGSDKHFELFNTDSEYKENYCKKVSDGIKNSYKNGRRVNVISTACTMSGKKHTDETKNKISKSQKGSGNSQYRTCWIYHPELKENKKIDKTLLDDYTQQGWIKGRKMKDLST